jgi:hypothetical protein
VVGDGWRKGLRHGRGLFHKRTNGGAIVDLGSTPTHFS